MGGGNGPQLSGRPPPTVPSCQLSPFVPSPQKVARGWLTSLPLLPLFSFSPCLISLICSTSPLSFILPLEKGLLGPSVLSHFPGATSVLSAPSQSQAPATQQWPSVPPIRETGLGLDLPPPLHPGVASRKIEEKGEGKKGNPDREGARDEE